LHCYSASGPEERDQLPAALLCESIDDAKAAGYSVAAFSGGEPLIYKPLRGLLEHARGRGMLATVTSNGMLLDGRRLALLQGAVDLLAISLDGMPASHNRMRADDRAFDAMAANLEGVRASGIPFGFIFTLTQYNLHELPWVADFALAQGAKLLQIHPLEEAGRARQLLAGERPDAVETSFAFVVAARVREIARERLYVQIDLLSRNHLRDQPERVFAAGPHADADCALAELVSPLVIEADGCVVPVQHGFPREYALGNLNDAALRDLMARWRRDCYGMFRNLCKDVFEELTAPAELPLANWYELLARRAKTCVAK
jgi:MoaA/NifB/PqqE/SkfB family radical SAM enzyme